MGIKIDNSAIVNGGWGGVNKAELGKKLEEAGSAAAINEAYLYSPDKDHRSTWKFPHHVLEGDTLKVHAGGVHSAAQRLVSTGETATSMPKKAGARHLLKHYRAMGETPPESLASIGKAGTVDEITTYLTFLKSLEAETGYDEDSLTEILEEIEEMEGILSGQEGSSSELVAEMALKSINLPNFKANKDGTATITKAATFKFKGKTKKEDYYPSDQELAEIVSDFTLIDWTNSDFYVFTMLAADLQVDRQYEHFMLNGLVEAASVLKGKPWLFEPHVWTSSNEIGRILDAWVENDDSLMLKVYIRNSAKNADILDNIFAGVHSGVSIGFTSQFADMVCDSCTASGKTVSIFDENRCGHQPGTYDEFGNPTRVSITGVLDGFEVSGAPVPAQRPSHILNKAMDGSNLNLGEKSMSADQTKVIAAEVVIPMEEETVKSVKPPMEEEMLDEECMKEVKFPEAQTSDDNKDEIPLSSAADDDKSIDSADKVVRTQDDEFLRHDNSDTAGTIKSEDSIIKDSSHMKNDLNNDQEELNEEDVKKKDMDTLGADADDEDIEKNPVSGREPPLWSVELKTMISDMNATLTTIKGGMEGLVAFAEQSKAVLNRYTTPEDGSDPEWEIRTVKQREIAEEQVQILEGLVVKTLEVLDVVATDSKKEVTPSRNDWARKLTKKLVSGENK